MTMQVMKTKSGQNYLTEKEEKKFFHTISRIKGKDAERDYVLLKLTRLTGLRRSEVVSLDVGDVRGTDRIYLDEKAAKGAKGYVHIPVELQNILMNFLRKKKKWGESVADDAPLFVSKKGRRLSIRTFNMIMDRWCKEAGIPKYTPHALRHTKARRIMDDYMTLDPEERVNKLNFVNRQLRHKSLNSTMIYLQPTKEEMSKVGAI